MAQDDDSGTAFDASIAYTAPTNGSYYLDVISNMGLWHSQLELTP